jgi:hypothetical protein
LLPLLGHRASWNFVLLQFLNLGQSVGLLGRVKGKDLGHPVSGGYKHGDLALQVGGVTNLRQ